MPRHGPGHPARVKKMWQLNIWDAVVIQVEGKKTPSAMRFYIAILKQEGFFTGGIHNVSTMIH